MPPQLVALHVARNPRISSGRGALADPTGLFFYCLRQLKSGSELWISHPSSREPDGRKFGFSATLMGHGAPPRTAFQPGYEKTRSTTPVGRGFRWRRAPCPIANKGNDVVRISSRTWTLAQIEDLAALIATGSTAANAAVALRRSITVVRAKARNLGTPFQIIAEDRRRLKPSQSFIYARSRFRATHEV